ncbi:MAG: permease [Bdellovibrionales bacterium]|nr:permease [Bdellovibrionales bacterium]
MNTFLELWAKSATVSIGFFWMAFWAFGLGYVISSMIQVFVTEQRMKKSMGEAGAKSIALGTFFGFISSSCSFAALSTTRALFTKGAGLIPALAFLLASTNLVIELGIIISIFLSWQFVVGEYLGGLLLIVLMSIVVKLSLPKDLERKARENAKSREGQRESEEIPDWKKLIKSKKGWIRVSQKYVMEWLMVWKDVSVGFTVAGIISAFVPKAFFETLFVGAGSDDPNFYQILLQAIVGPVAAFFTFIGSMGNIPLAAVLYSNGVSFAGIMAFIFSDLVVFPVLRIQAKYYGWKMALYILGVFLLILIFSSIIMHYGFSVFDALPETSVQTKVTDREFFKIDYTFFLNLVFALFSGIAIFLHIRNRKSDHKMSDSSLTEKVLFRFAMMAYCWLTVGLGLKIYFGLSDFVF